MTTAPDSARDAAPDTDKPSTRIDTGFTLVEVIVTTTMIGLVAVVIAASITVVFRTERPVNSLIGESHDIQQAVNYFHEDVESGPGLVADWVVSGTTGSGCQDAGTDNVFRYDVIDELGDPERRVAYRLAPTTIGARLDRYDCEFVGGTPTPVVVINIADRLDTSAGPAVVVNVVPEPVDADPLTPPDTDPSRVDRVTMEFAQTIAEGEFAATPRAGADVAAGDGPCGADPLEAAVGYGAFVETETDIFDFVDGTDLDIKGSLATGGALGWDGVVKAADTDSNNAYGFSNVGVYAGSINWPVATSTNSLLTTAPAGNVNIVIGGSYYQVTSGGTKNLHESALDLDPTLTTKGSVDNPAAIPLDFGVQFDQLKSCSNALAGLPDNGDAVFAQAWSDSAGTIPYTGSGDLYVEFNGAAATTQVLNVRETTLANITSITKIAGSFANGKPLVINIIEDPLDGDDDVLFNLSATSWEAVVGDLKFVIYNFPNTIGTVTFPNGVSGTVFAPYSEVNTHQGVKAAVVARKWTHFGDSANIPIDNTNQHWFTGVITLY